MQIPREHIVLGLIALTLIFLVAGAFLVMYVLLYNQRKRKHLQEKEFMTQNFQQEIVTTRMEVQEQTLQNIASDIHDNVGQLLSLTKITLGSINLNDNDQEKLSGKLNGAMNLLDKSVKELRHLATILHAKNILAEGLEKAIENELAWLARSEQFKIHKVVTGKNILNIQPDRELIAFRIVQEVLNNIIKHAEASDIMVEFNYKVEELCLIIHDNGKGFNLESTLRKKNGMGIDNFYHRANMIGGNFTLNSIPENGTTATLQIPYSL